eukprot:3715808-Prymnesium_polylepis.1
MPPVPQASASMAAACASAAARTANFTSRVRTRTTKRLVAACSDCVSSTVHGWLFPGTWFLKEHFLGPRTLSDASVVSETFEADATAR